MSEITPTKILDARGLQCPMPVVKTSQEVKSMAADEILKVMATDPGSMADITAWCKSTGNELMSMGKDDAVFVFYLKKVV